LDIVLTSLPGHNPTISEKIAEKLDSEFLLQESDVDPCIFDIGVLKSFSALKAVLPNLGAHMSVQMHRGWEPL